MAHTDHDLTIRCQSVHPSSLTESAKCSREKSGDWHNADDALLLLAHAHRDVRNVADDRRRNRQQPVTIAKDQVAGGHAQAANRDRMTEVDDVHEGMGHGDGLGEALEAERLTPGRSRTEPLVT